MTKNASHRRGEEGIRLPVSHTTPNRITAARPTWHSTMVSGVMVFTATPTKKKEPPQITDKQTIRSHSPRPMTVFTVGCVADGKLLAEACIAVDFGFTTVFSLKRRIDKMASL
jgi:hypothetical protein